MPRAGWTKLPGSSERYRSPSGAIVSRRQYDNARFEGTPFVSRSQFERRHEDRTYTWAIAQAALNEGKSRRDIDRVGSPVAQWVQRGVAAKRAGNRSARGAYAKMLVRLGLRDPNATYQVGDTPGRKR